MSVPSSPATRLPKSPAKSTSTQARCAALDASGVVCNVSTKSGTMWCPRHNEERVKLYVNYKAHHTALDAFLEDSICGNVDEVMRCDSLDILQTWNKALLSKYQLLTRCIAARAYFTERFFGNDMDFGHKTYWDSLVKQRADLEERLSEVERRGYQLILHKQNALWVLERHPEKPEEMEEDCSGHEDVPLVSKPPKPVVEVVEVEDPLDVALREKAWQLRERIRTRLARYCAPSFSAHYQERFKVVFACVRRAIYTDPALMLLAQKYKTVMSLLQNSVNLDVAIVEKLWNAISNLSIFDVRAAADDVLRPKGNEDYVLVLGGRVYKDLGCTTWPFHAWGHLAAVYTCYSCVRRTCKTVDEIVALTRFVALTQNGRSIAQSNLKYDFEYEGARTLVLCGFIPNAMTSLGPRFTVTKTKCSFQKNAYHWTETQTNQILCAGLSLTDPKSQAFVNKCLKHPDFMVLVRKGANGRIIRSTPKIWADKVREAHSKAELAKISWDSVKRAAYLRDSVLEEAMPIISVAGDRLEDCLQVAIVDRGKGEMADFVLKLEKIWLEVYGAESITDILAEVGEPMLNSGEIEFKANKVSGMFPVVPNVEEDVTKSYKRLWGVAPKALADDQYPIRKRMTKP